MTPTTETRVIDLMIRLLFLGLFIFSALVMIAPLMGIVAWGVILCVAVYPIFDWLQRLLGGREILAAILLTLVGLAVTLGPVAALVASLVEVGFRLAEILEDGALDLPPIPEFLATLPVVGSDLSEVWELAGQNLQEALTRFGPLLLSAGGTFAAKLAEVGFGLVAMSASVLVMGVLFKPAPALADFIRRFANRVFAPKGAGFVDLAGATVRNVSRGVIGVAFIQALLAGIVMVAFGVKGAGAVALAALILSIIQVGPGPVLIPTVIWAWTWMDTGMALAFTLLMIPVMIVDNFLRPIIMAAGLSTPMVVILVGVIGGMIAYGLIGIFIGPVILAVFYDLVIGWIDAGETSGEEAEEPGESAS